MNMLTLTRWFYFLTVTILFILPGIKYGHSQSTFLITYNAGNGPLAGVSPVYMYAGVGIDQPGNFWQYNVGHNTNPGIGLMDSVGSDLWSICLEPYSYFSQGPAGPIPPGAVIYNLSMVFHNQDFTIMVSTDPNNMPINIVMTSIPPASSWVLVSGVYQNCSPFGVAELTISKGVLSHYPNPTTGPTRFIFTLSEKGLVKINVFNSLGGKIHELKVGNKNPGTYSISWDLKHPGGQPLADGLYFYNLEVNGEIIQTNRLIISGR